MQKRGIIKLFNNEQPSQNSKPGKGVKGLVGDDPAVVGGIGRFEGVPVTVLGQVKGHNTKENLAHNFGMAHPEGFRKCLRLVRQAAKFHRPVISFIDSPGAYFGIDAEERGQAWAIASNLLRLLTN